MGRQRQLPVLRRIWKGSSRKERASSLSMFEICALLILSFSSLHSRLLFLLLGDVRHSVALTAAGKEPF